MTPAHFCGPGIPWNERQKSHSKKFMEVLVCAITVLGVTTAAGGSLIMVTHDDSLASQANRIIRVSDGKILE